MHFISVTPLQFFLHYVSHKMRLTHVAPVLMAEIQGQLRASQNCELHKRIGCGISCLQVEQ